MALDNPNCMAEALADPERVREAKAKLEEAGVKYILSVWIDLLGVPKTKPVPISDFELLCAGKGPQFAVHSISFVPELGPADADQIMVPDLDSLVICPWDKTCAWVFADLWWQDKPYNLCPRSASEAHRARRRRPTATRSWPGWSRSSSRCAGSRRPAGEGLRQRPAAGRGLAAAPPGLRLRR